MCPVWLAVTLLLLLQPVRTVSNSNAYRKHLECDFVFKFTDPRIGIGVYANKMIPSGSVIQHAIGIPIPIGSVYSNELINYVEGHNSTHAVVTLGYAMMMNHITDTWKPMTRKESFGLYSQSSGILRLSRGFGISEDTIITANYDIYPGEQLLSFYGWSWFEDRKMNNLLVIKGNLVHAQIISNDNSCDEISTGGDTLEESTLPGCPTLFTQLDENTGHLIAASALVAGQTIEVSRALLLPVAQMSEPNALEDILWWPFTTNHTHSPLQRKSRRRLDPYSARFDEHESYALLLLGHGALYSSNKTSDANVLYSWWNTSTLFGQPQAEVESADQSCFQKKRKKCTETCSTTAFVSFVAARDIAIGEILTVYLSTYYDYIRRIERRFPAAASFKQNCMIPSTS